MHETPAAKDALQDALTASPRLRGFAHGHAGAVRCVAFSPDGTRVASGSADHTIVLWDPATRRRSGAPLIGHPGEVRSLAFSPDGRVLASGDSQGVVILWGVAAHRPLEQRLDAHKRGVDSVAFSGDGRTLFSASQDNEVVVWDLSSREPTDRLLRMYVNSSTSITFAPDRTLVALGVFDGGTNVVDLDTERPITRKPVLWDHRTAVTNVAFSRDGRMIASGGEDKTIVVRQMPSAQRIGRALKGHTAAVRALAFSPDGHTLIAGGADRALAVWDIADPYLGDQLPRSAGDRPSPGPCPDSWARARVLANRNFTCPEWKELRGAAPYRAVFPDLPAEACEGP